MLSKCHELASEFLVSDTVLKLVELPKYLKADEMGIFKLKGKLQEMVLHSLSLTKSTDALIQHRPWLLGEKEKKIVLNKLVIRICEDRISL